MLCDNVTCYTVHDWLIIYVRAILGGHQPNVKAICTLMFKAIVECSGLSLGILAHAIQDQFKSKTQSFAFCTEETCSNIDLVETAKCVEEKDPNTFLIKISLTLNRSESPKYFLCAKLKLLVFVLRLWHIFVIRYCKFIFNFNCWSCVFSQ